MNTECFTKKIQFQDVGSRKLEADFSAIDHIYFII